MTVIKTVVDMIKYAYQNPKGAKRFVDFYIYSPEAGKGTGKTVFALKIMKQIYGDWDKALNYLFVDPSTTISFIVDLVKRRKRVPVFTCDDIGMWFSGLTYSMSKGQERRALVALYEFYNAIRSISASCIFTSPIDDLVKSVFKQVNFRIAVEPIDEDRCSAKIYKVKTNPLFKQFVKKDHIEVFNVWIPDEIYKKYEEKRWNALEWKAKTLLKMWGDAKEEIDIDQSSNNKEVYIPADNVTHPLNIYPNYYCHSQNTYAKAVGFPKKLAEKYGLKKGDTFVWVDIGFPIGVPDIYFEKFMQIFFRKEESKNEDSG